METRDTGNAPRIFIDGATCDGIVDLDQVPGHYTPATPQVGDPATLEHVLTPETAAAITEAAIQAAKFLRKLVERLTDPRQRFIDGLLWQACEKPRMYHLYKHAKKARTSKKNRRRLMKLLYSKMKAAADEGGNE